MTTTVDLRLAVTGLLALAVAEEQALLAATAFAAASGASSGAAYGTAYGTAYGAAYGADPGSPDNWAAVPLVAHDNQFKSQQAERLRAILAGKLPPAFGEVDHARPRSTAATAPSPPRTCSGTAGS